MASTRASTISNIACPAGASDSSCSLRCLAISMLEPPASGIVEDPPGSSNCSCMSPTGGHHLYLLDGRRIPLASQGVGQRRVEPHRQIERSLRCWKPVRFLALARTVALKIKIERTVRVVVEGHPTAHCKSIQNIPNLEAIRVVKRERPECAHRRRRALLEVNRVLVRSIQRLAGFVGK